MDKIVGNEDNYNKLLARYGKAYRYFNNENISLEEKEKNYPEFLKLHRIIVEAFYNMLIEE